MAVMRGKDERAAPVLDFKTAYRERHGSEPALPQETPYMPAPAPQKSTLVMRMRALDIGTNKEKREPIAKLDLESGRSGRSVCRNVAPFDVIEVCGGMGIFRIVFTCIDEQGGLECDVYNNGRHEGRPSLKTGEPEIFGRITLMDGGSRFTGYIGRLPLYSQEQGKIAGVHVWVKPQA